MTRHYVHVPGLGGFLLRDIDASYSNNIYTPSHKEVHFNRFLNKEDGFLAGAYMESEGLSYDDAIALINIEVSKIKDTLSKKKPYNLGSLGQLSYDSDKYIVVKNPKTFTETADNYGLAQLKFQPWEEVEGKISSKYYDNKNEEISISIPKYWLTRAAAILILVLCVVANTVFNKHEILNRNTASVLNTEILFGNDTPYVSQIQTWDSSWEDETVLEEIESEVNTLLLSSAEDLSENELAEELLEVNSESPTTVTKVSGKQYYIIIASFSTMADAERGVQEQNAKGYSNVGILERDGRFRLYLKTFTIKEEGEKYLEEVRTSTPFATAWMLPVRSESLISYNFKNIDNDQLPMELSHPYKRTERDKGWLNT